MNSTTNSINELSFSEKKKNQKNTAIIYFIPLVLMLSKCHFSLQKDKRNVCQNSMKFFGVH